MARSFVVPGLPDHAQLSTVTLLIIAIVGTTVAPWQLFFQQSYVIDKRITPRFLKYERADLWIGIVLVVIGAAAMFGFSSATFAGHSGFGHFTDAAGTAEGLSHYVSRLAGDLFAIALLDASIIGAAAVGLATAYATSDVLSLSHSLHRPITRAKGFYACYSGLMAVAATLVLIPGVPLGLLTEGVQTLAGVLLPSATVFLLLLCNDRAVLGPWVNSKKLNIFTSAVVWVLVLLSIILTAGVLFPGITGPQIEAVLVGGVLLGSLVGIYLLVHGRRSRADTTVDDALADAPPRDTWRMPALARLARPAMSTQRKIGLLTLRGYLVVAFGLVVVKLVQVAVG
jgi:Mn2+/Fe2+ NRAMP family transporter